MTLDRRRRGLPDPEAELAALQATVRSRRYKWGALHLKARWNASEFEILYRIDDDPEWHLGPCQVAAAGHNTNRAFALVNQWLKSQNPS